MGSDKKGFTQLMGSDKKGFTQLMGSDKKIEGFHTTDG